MSPRHDANGGASLDRGVGKHRHGFGATRSQTRAHRAAIVIAEGGGTPIPTLGGGIGKTPPDAALGVAAR